MQRFEIWKVNDFYDNLKIGIDLSMYPRSIMSEFMEKAFNYEDCVPSILLDYLVYHSEGRAEKLNISI